MWQEDEEEEELLDDLKDRRGYSHLKEEALDLSSDRILNNNNNVPIHIFTHRRFWTNYYYLYIHIFCFSILFLIIWSKNYLVRFLKVPASELTPLTHSLTPYSTVLLEKLTGSQLVKKFPTFYATRRFVTFFTRAQGHINTILTEQVSQLYRD